jgi:pyruvate/2-oxoglutarate dehydrogenase complex dihydrolipoamide dehydrogenase (E3) component
MASLEDKNTIVFNNSRIKAEYIVLAVGGRPKGLPIEG